jgi:hypothetical protein
MDVDGRPRPGTAERPTIGGTLTAVLKRQLDCSLEMLAKAIELCPDDAWADDSGHAPVWEQVYHALFWFNAWLRDWQKPIEYPEFHIAEALDIKRRAGKTIDRSQILAYLAKVSADYEAFMTGVDDAGLLDTATAFGRQWTTADRILGQVRHIQHHVGYLNAILSASRGVRVHWVGYGER